ncbi:NAD-dependent epimerase/dehydratase family protein [Hoeflea sp.]|uniref:NAD-dependent epimerase/dehydratase family protein n=1 Tax=Hoeflea sp. TaxID=1940281 RepID=UPI003B02B549
MKLLLTGASSFTGYWFARALADAGHTVIAPLLGTVKGYTGVRGERVKSLAEFAEVVEECPFGSDAFRDAIEGLQVDLLCHHAALVTGYRDPGFDILNALSNNTERFDEVLNWLEADKFKGVLLTGSVFEQDEGAGDAPRDAFSTYGMSKTLTSQLVAYICRSSGVPFHKFVIPNPFGPYEERKFTSYLVQTWQRGETASVKTPDYVRDNIHVDLLALAYARFVSEIGNGTAKTKINPSGYVSTQADFARRFSSEIGRRLGLECPLDLPLQSDFSEPIIRINTDSARHYVEQWDEERAWDRLAEHYRSGDAIR